MILITSQKGNKTLIGTACRVVQLKYTASQSVQPYTLL